MSPSGVYPVLIKLYCFYFNQTLTVHPWGPCKLFIGRFKDARRRDKQRLSWQPNANKSSLTWLRRFNIKEKRVRFLKWQMASLRSPIIILDKKGFSINKLPTSFFADPCLSRPLHHLLLFVNDQWLITGGAWLTHRTKWTLEKVLCIWSGKTWDHKWKVNTTLIQIIVFTYTNLTSSNNTQA